MPYVICAGCDLRTYSAALWASTEECPRCGTRLPSAQRIDLLVRAAQAELADLPSTGDDCARSLGEGDGR